MKLCKSDDFVLNFEKGQTAVGDVADAPAYHTGFRTKIQKDNVCCRMVKMVYLLTMLNWSQKMLELVDSDEIDVAVVISKLNNVAHDVVLSFSTKGGLSREMQRLKLGREMISDAYFRLINSSTCLSFMPMYSTETNQTSQTQNGALDYFHIQILTESGLQDSSIDIDTIPATMAESFSFTPSLRN